MRISSRFLVLTAAFALHCRPPHRVEEDNKRPQEKASATTLNVEKAQALIQKDLALTGPERKTFLFHRDFERVQETRQLQALEPLNAQVLAPAELALYVRTLVERDHQQTQYRNETFLLKILELLPWSLDRKAAELALLGQELNGLYDPQAKTFIIRDSLSPAMKKLTIFHELTHALQDQHFNLGERLEYEPGTGDQRAALLSLAEGDALLTMVKAVLDEAQTEFSLHALEPLRSLYDSDNPAHSNSDTPRLLTLAALAPYEDGLRFAEYLYRKGGMAALNAAWLAPPQTTEQLLHPAQYEAGVLPVQLPLRRDHDDYCHMYGDTLGEQAMRIISEVWSNAPLAHEAADGWDGDRMGLFSQGPCTALKATRKTTGFVAWDIAFNTPEDMRQFQVLLEQYLGEPAQRSLKTPADVCRSTAKHQTPFLITANKNSLQLRMGPVLLYPELEAISRSEANFSQNCSALHAFQTSFSAASVH